MSESKIIASIETPVLNPSKEEFVNFAKFVQSVEKVHSFALVRFFSNN